jgi:hypothetical protein
LLFCRAGAHDNIKGTATETSLRRNQEPMISRSSGRERTLVAKRTMEWIEMVATRAMSAASAPFVAHELVGEIRTKSNRTVVLKRGSVE